MTRTKLLELAERCEARAIGNLKWFFRGDPTHGFDILGQAELMFKFANELRARANQQEDGNGQ